MKATLADNVKARELLPDGSYRRVKPAAGEPLLRSQQRLLELAEAGTRQLGVGPIATETPAAPPVLRPARKTRTKR